MHLPPILTSAPFHRIPIHQTLLNTLLGCLKLLHPHLHQLSLGLVGFHCLFPEYFPPLPCDAHPQVCLFRVPCKWDPAISNEHSRWFWYTPTRRITGYRTEHRHSMAFKTPSTLPDSPLLLLYSCMFLCLIFIHSGLSLLSPEFFAASLQSSLDPLQWCSPTFKCLESCNLYSSYDTWWLSPLWDLHAWNPVLHASLSSLKFLL